jgi:hypothetical protein
MTLRARSRLRLVAASFGFMAVATACISPPVDSPKSHPVQDTPFRVVPGNRVDVLFMIDNSSSMDPMQKQLRDRFPQFLKVFDDLAAAGFYTDLRIGVVTSDFGAGGPGDGPFTPGRPFCGHSPGGDMGLLQRKGKAAVNCQGLPADGPPFITYVYDKNGGTNNLPAGQSLADTFTCMASVGALGCGFEHQLESVWQALKHPAENRSFVRDDALLAVVFVTNEDDGSAAPNADFYNDDPAKLAAYGAYDTYRQTRFGVACGSPLMLAPSMASGGPLLSCVPASASPESPGPLLEYDVQRYKNLFTLDTAHGGVKDDPDDVLLFAIDGPETPFEVVSVQQQVEPSAHYMGCGASTNCLTRLQRSCINQIDEGFFADPAVRLNDVLRAAKSSSISSICGDDPGSAPDFSKAMQKLATDIIVKLPGCIPARLPDVDHPDCVVVQHSSDGHGGTTDVVIPQCSDKMRFPCWRLETKPQCHTAQNLALTVDRNGQPAPPETHLQVECSTVAEGP